MKNVIRQGAEAILIKDGKFLLKERITKSYRIKEIDYDLRKLRTRNEAKLLNKVKINAPRVYEVDETNMTIKMEFVDGQLVKDVFDGLKNKDWLCKEIGRNIASLHEQNIIHGDLTTSNLILKDDKVYFIDFGLGFVSEKVEDKAVDLHLLRQAFESKHYKYAEEAFENVLKGYSCYKNYKEIIKRLEKVESRGRYKKKNVKATNTTRI